MQKKCTQRNLKNSLSTGKFYSRKEGVEEDGPHHERTGNKEVNSKNVKNVYAQ